MKIEKNLIIRIASFLIGYLGLTVVLNVLSFLPSSGMSKDLYVAKLYFLTYAITFICLILIIGFDEIKTWFTETKISRDIKDGLAIGIILMSCTVLYNLIINEIVPIEDNANETSVKSILIASPTISIITIAVIGPIFEEITYRYGLFGSLKKINRPLAYIVTGILFGLIHFDYACFDKGTALNEFLNLPIYISSGLLLNYAYDKNDSIITSSVAHLLNNIISVLSVFL